MDSRLVILSRGPGLYSTKRLVEEAEAAGWAVRIIDPLSLDYVIDDTGVRIFNKGWLWNAKRSSRGLATRLPAGASPF